MWHSTCQFLQLCVLTILAQYLNELISIFTSKLTARIASWISHRSWAVLVVCHPLHGHMLCLMPESKTNLKTETLLLSPSVRWNHQELICPLLTNSYNDTILRPCLLQLWHSTGSSASLFPHAAADWEQQSFWIVSQSKYGAFSMIFPWGLSSVFSSALGELLYMWNDCLHTELKFITLSIVVSWSDIILLLITKGHTLQIHWTNQTKSTKGNTRMNHKQLLQRCSCTYLFLQLYLKCKKVVVIHINSLVMNCPLLSFLECRGLFPQETSQVHWADIGRCHSAFWELDENISQDKTCLSYDSSSQRI